MIKPTLVFFILLFFSVPFFFDMGFAAQQPAVFSEQISNELEFVEIILDKGIVDGDIDKLVESHRILSNLGVTLKDLNDFNKRALFTLAIGYAYVRMCPSAFFFQLSSPDNPTGFTINCVEKSMEYFTNATQFADDKLDKTAAADTYFFAGIGIDRLKSNMSGVPGVNTDGFLKEAKENIRKAVEMGPSFEGAATILRRFDRREYIKSPVVDDKRFHELRRMLVLDETLPEPAVFHEATAENMMDVPDTPAVVEDDTYMDYRWRFSIRRPDGTWKFTSRKDDNSLHLLIKKKKSGEQKGSGLNIICNSLENESSTLTLEQLVDKSITLLEQAGYNVDSKKITKLARLPAYEVVLTHKYNELIPVESIMTETTAPGAVSSKSLASRQYMIVILSSGIQYTISFSSLDNEYAGIFVMYHNIVNTVKIF